MKKFWPLKHKKVIAAQLVGKIDINCKMRLTGETSNAKYKIKVVINLLLSLRDISQTTKKFSSFKTHKKNLCFLMKTPSWKQCDQITVITYHKKAIGCLSNLRDEFHHKWKKNFPMGSHYQVIRLYLRKQVKSGMLFLKVANFRLIMKKIMKIY